jgi:L-threonylcarbamoyladenylate synthase
VVAEVGDRLDPSRDLVVDGGPCAVGVESTIVDCTASPPRVLRLGAISQAQVDAALAGDLLQTVAGPEASRAGTGSAAAGRPEVRAPGTLDSHYAPRARVLLVEAEPAGTGLEAEPAGTGLDAVPGSVGSRIGLLALAEVVTPAGWARLAAPGSAEQYARDLYGALRRADRLGLDVVVAVLPDAAGGPLALAVRDRLARAAHGG